MTNPLTVTIPEGGQHMEFTRDFDAPVSAVFAAHADSELLSRWLGPRNTTMRYETFDFRTGGSYRYLTGFEGESYNFRGTFHTVREDELIIQTFEFEGAPDAVFLEYLYFEDLGEGRSRLRGKSVASDPAVVAGMVESGMETGMSEGYEKLDELLATLG